MTALLAPAKTPPEIVAKLEKATLDALQAAGDARAPAGVRLPR